MTKGFIVSILILIYVVSVKGLGAHWQHVPMKSDISEPSQENTNEDSLYNDWKIRRLENTKKQLKKQLVQKDHGVNGNAPIILPHQGDTSYPHIHDNIRNPQIAHRDINIHHKPQHHVNMVQDRHREYNTVGIVESNVGRDHDIKELQRKYTQIKEDLAQQKDDLLEEEDALDGTNEILGNLIGRVTSKYGNEAHPMNAHINGMNGMNTDVIGHYRDGYRDGFKAATKQMQNKNSGE